jgi:MFS family permease
MAEVDRKQGPEAIPAAAARRGWLTRSVLGFGLASFLSDLGHEAATAALPALLLALGAAPAALGIIEGVSDGLASFAKLYGGWLADRPSWRKPIAVAGYLVTGLSTGAFGLAHAWPHVQAARGIGWLARGLRGPPRDAMLAEAVPAAKRGRAFGFHRAMDSAGAALGPAIAAVLITFVPVRVVFYLSVAPGVLSAAAFAALVRRDGSPSPADPRPLWTSVRALPARFRRFLASVFLFGLGDFARTLLILRATTLLTPTLGPAQASAAAMAMYVGHNVLYAAASFPVGWLADRVLPQRLLVLGYLLGGLTAILAATATASWGMLVALFATAGLTLAFEDTLEGTLTALEVPPALRGTGYGVLATTNGIGDLVSSALVGVLWSAVGAETAFGVAAAFCFAGALLLTRLR